MNPRVNNVKYESPYRLVVWFANGEVKRFDLKPYLPYPIYEKLRDEAYGSRARVQNGVVVWDEETDIDPDRLYLEGKPLVAVNVENTDKGLNG